MKHDYENQSMQGRMSMTREDWRLLHENSVVRAKGIERSPIGQHFLHIAEFADSMVKLLDGYSDSEHVDVEIEVSSAVASGWRFSPKKSGEPATPRPDSVSMGAVIVENDSRWRRA